MPQLLLNRKVASGTSGTQTILLVEDQPAIRQHMVNLPRRSALSGFGVARWRLRAGDGAEHKGRIDLLLTNFSMPGISGRSWHGSPKRSVPGSRCCTCPGIPEEMVWAGEFLKQRPSWLAKPFTKQLLAAGLRKSLGAPRRVVLVVDEDAEVRNFLREPLQNSGYQVFEAVNLRLAKEVLDANRVDLLIGDLARFEQEGEGTVRKLRRSYSATRSLR